MGEISLKKLPVLGSHTSGEEGEVISEGLEEMEDQGVELTSIKSLFSEESSDFEDPLSGSNEFRGKSSKKEKNTLINNKKNSKSLRKSSRRENL